MLRAALLCGKKKCQSSCFEQQQFLTTWLVVCDVRETTKKPSGFLPQCECLTANERKKKSNTATTGTNLQNILGKGKKKKKDHWQQVCQGPTTKTKKYRFIHVTENGRSRDTFPHPTAGRRLLPEKHARKDAQCFCVLSSSSFPGQPNK